MTNKIEGVGDVKIRCYEDNIIDEWGSERKQLFFSVGFTPTARGVNFLRSFMVKTKAERMIKETMLVFRFIPDNNVNEYKTLLTRIEFSAKRPLLKAGVIERLGVGGRFFLLCPENWGKTFLYKDQRDIESKAQGIKDGINFLAAYQRDHDGRKIKLVIEE